MYENGTNVGMGMAPHRKGCRCDECEIDRLQRHVRMQKQVTIDLEESYSKKIERLQAEVERHRKIKCPDNPGGRHRWNGDGQCLDCSNYATDLIDSTLPTKSSEHPDARK